MTGYGKVSQTGSCALKLGQTKKDETKDKSHSNFLATPLLPSPPLCNKKRFFDIALTFDSSRTFLLQ